EKDVVGDLADASELAFPDIGDAARRKLLDQWPYRAAGGFRPRHHRRELAGLDGLRVAAHRRRHERGAALAKAGSDRSGLLDPDGRAIDEDLRQLAAFACCDAALAEQHGLDIAAGGYDREQHVDIGEIGGALDDAAALLRQRLGLCACPVPDRHLMPGIEQPLRHGIAHAADADPTDLLLALRHALLLRPGPLSLVSPRRFC